MRRAFIGLVCLLGLSTPAVAQEAGNVATSFAIMHDSELSETFPMGWALAVTGNPGRMFGVVGEVGGSYKTMSIFGTDLNLRVHSFMAGVRFMNQTSNARPFAQLLVGGVKGSVSMLGISDSGTNLAFQPGGGVDIGITRSFGLRVQGDYRIITGDGDSTNEFRFAVGPVFSFGKM